MKKIIATYLMIVGLSVGLVACHHDDDPEEDPIADRTILVYMAAENDLSSFADSDLKEMKEASLKLNDRQKLVVYVDQAATTPPFYARVKDGKLVDTLWVEESITADPAVLESALRHVRTSYQAHSYGLVLWGHASGWLVNNDSVVYNKSRAYGGDTGNNVSSRSIKFWMNIPSMARAISNGMDGKPLKFIMGDCCSFGCAEVAYELRKFADYVIGSPAEVPDEGAPFDLIIPEMYNNNDDFYKGVIDQYYQYYLKAFEEQPNRYMNISSGDLKGYSVPLVAVKTSELDALATATAQLCSTIHDELTPTGNLDLTGKINYAMYSSYRYSYDMYQVLKYNTPSNNFNTWATVFWKAVPYRTTSNRWLTGYHQLGTDMLSFDEDPSNVGVLSMFFPRNIYKNTNPNWNQAIKMFQWNNVIRWEDYDW